MKTSRSKILLLIEAIAMFVLVLPFTIGTFIDGDPETSPAIVNFLKDGNTLMIPIFIMVVYSIVSFGISISDIKKGGDSPFKMSLITEVLSIIWCALVFYLWVKFMNSSYVGDQDTKNNFAYVFVVFILSALSVWGMAVAFVIVDFSIRFHAFAYAVSLISKKEKEAKTLIIFGMIFSLILPFVGQILLLVYEKGKRKDIIDQ